MAARILDYERPGKDTRGSGAYAPSSLPVFTSSGIQSDVPTGMPLACLPRREIESYPLSKRPLDYPAIADWLKTCDNDLERGRDNHGYTILSPVFAINGCTRVDDITRLSGDRIKVLADEQGVSITIGLANQVQAYAAEDVARIRGEGKLTV